MAFQPVPDVAQVRLEGRQDGQLTLNNLYFNVSGGGITPTNLATLALQVAVWWEEQMMPNISQDFTAVGVTAFDLGAPDGAIVTQPVNIPGSIASEANANNVAACISIRTASRGRSGRGRNYICGVPNSMVVLNTLASPWMEVVVEAYLAMVGAGTFAPGWQWVIVNRQLDGVVLPSGAYRVVTGAYFTAPYVRSMRSREVGHGA